MNVRTTRRAMERGKRISLKVPAEALEHRKGTAAAKAAKVFERNWGAYLKGDLKRKVLIEKAAKVADISVATASTYLHNFAQSVAQ